MASDKNMVYPNAEPESTAAEAPCIDYGTAPLDVTGHHSHAMELEWRGFRLELQTKKAVSCCQTLEGERL